VTKSTRNQQSYTEGILQAAGQDAASYTSVIKIWWWNHTDPGHLRLSKPGIQYIKKYTRIPVYECNLPEPLKNRTLVQLGRSMTCPYYIIKGNQILLLGEEETVLLKLHADNLQQYLDNITASQ
jgi:hypothetical protein